jgi:hypothetical protein
MICSTGIKILSMSSHPKATDTWGWCDMYDPTRGRKQPKWHSSLTTDDSSRVLPKFKDYEI